MKDMKNADAIERVMLDNGGYAPLSLLYRDVWKHKDRRKIKGLTPNDTIRRWVQTDTRSRFVRIGLGVYALESVYKAGKLPVASPAQPPKERRHSEIEGMLIEIGNLTPGVANTYTPDRSAIFQNKKLGNIATLEESPKFTYPEVVKVVKRVDVAWFNDGGGKGIPLTLTKWSIPGSLIAPWRGFPCCWISARSSIASPNPGERGNTSG